MKLKLEQNASLPGYLSAIGATAIWSGNFIIARGLSDQIPPFSLAFWRWSVAVLVLLPFALKSLIKDRHEIKKHLPYITLVSLLGITTFNTLIYFAGQTTTAINLSVISITFPIFIIIFLRIFMKVSISFIKAIGLVTVILGVLILITKGNLSILMSISFVIGDFWMLMAAIIFAVYSIILRKKPKGISLWSFQLSTFILGLIFLTPFFIGEQLMQPDIVYKPEMIFSILYIGIFASLAAFALWNRAILSIGPSKSGMVYYTLPIFSAASAYFFLGENLQSFHFISFIVIVAGIVISNYKR